MKKVGKKVRRKGLPTVKTVMGKVLKDFIYVFFGQPGIGKTFFVNDFPLRVLFLSNDRGTRSLKAMRRECNVWADYVEVIKLLKAGASKDYDIVCLDHVDEWAMSAENEILDRLGVESLGDAGWGKGWNTYKKHLNNFVSDLKSMDLGVVFIAHEIIRTVKQNGIEIDKVMPSMTKAAWNIIIPVADVVGYCNLKTVRSQGKRKEIRILETEPRRDLYVKDRTPRKKSVKGWEHLDGQKFMSTFE